MSMLSKGFRNFADGIHTSVRRFDKGVSDGWEGIKDGVKEGIKSAKGFVKGYSSPYEIDEREIDSKPFLDNAVSQQRIKGMQEQMDQSMGRGAPMIQGGPQSQVRGGQMDFIRALQNQAAGKGPSLAQNKLQQATDSNIASQMAIAASQGTSNPAAAMMNASRATEQARRQAGMDSSNLRLQEQMAARGMLGDALNNTRHQDIGIAGANQAANLQQRGLHDAQQRYFNDAIQRTDQFDRTAGMDLERLRHQQNFGFEQLGQQNHYQNRGLLGNLLGGAGAGLAGIGTMFSDKNLKTDIKSSKASEKQLNDFLGAITAHKYKYKDKAHGEHEYISPMAQDLEKSKIGKGMVIDTPVGKLVDYGKASGVMVATAAMLNGKVNKLESKLAKALAKRKAV